MTMYKRRRPSISKEPISGSFRRGQADWALWRLFNKSGHGNPPSEFLARLKRLLDIDRYVELGKDDRESPGFAFLDELPAGKGSEVRLTPFNIFCLAIGLDLLDMGFKQSEVVFLFKHVRKRFEAKYREILGRGLAYKREYLPAKDQPKLPVTKDKKYADPRIFAVIIKVELKEVYAPKGYEKPENPVIFEPKFFKGSVSLENWIDEMVPTSYRKLLAFELWSTAMRLQEYLRDVPDIRRGPKS